VQLLDAWPLTDDESIQTGTPLPPGTVLDLGAIRNALPAPELRRAGFGVVAGVGVLVPTLLRRAGRAAVSGADFARGVRDLAGDRLE
jgi:hypothetical protein